MEMTPTRTSTMTTTGTSKVTPNAMKVVSTKERYLSLSVIHATPSGATDAMNWKTSGNTRKHAKDIPTRNSTELATTRGSTRSFSFSYRPGATTPQTSQSTQGSAITTATRTANWT